MRGKLGVCLMAAISFLPASRATAQPQPSTVPLLWAHSRVTFDFLGGQFADQDLLITADGVARSTLITAANQGPVGWSVDRSVITATPAQLSTLENAIAAAHLGVQPGGCELPSRVPSTGTYELVWYGRGTRSNAISMTIASPSGSGSPCPAELSALIALLQLYGGAIAGD